MANGAAMGGFSVAGSSSSVLTGVSAQTKLPWPDKSRLKDRVTSVDRLGNFILRTLSFLQEAGKATISPSTTVFLKDAAKNFGSPQQCHDKATSSPHAANILVSSKAASAQTIAEPQKTRARTVERAVTKQAGSLSSTRKFRASSGGGIELSLSVFLTPLLAQPFAV
jgi:hypothetical protein